MNKVQITIDTPLVVGSKVDQFVAIYGGGCILYMGAVPTSASTGYRVAGGHELVVPAGVNLYATAEPGGEACAIVSDFPMLPRTSIDPNVARVRVDVAQTGFFDGREFRLVRKITSPVVFRFTLPVPAILFEQLLTVADGDIELFAWAASNVTPSGTWTPVTVWPKNGINTAYTRQTVVETGGTITVTDSDLYRDYARVATSVATAQRQTVGGAASSERYLAAGTYYVQLSGTGQGSYSVMFEERP